MKNMFRTSTIIAAVLVLFIGAAVSPYAHGMTPGQEKEPQTDTIGRAPINIPKIDAKIKVDGVIDEAAWQQALKFELKYEVKPGENIPAPVRTEVYIFYSKTHFYASFHAYDPHPSEIRAFYTDRDKIWDDDWVSVIVDTFNDQRQSFTFACNPLGVQADLLQSISGVNNNSWDTLWYSAGRLVEDGYVVEIALPFSSMRFQGKKDIQTWGLDLSRYYPRSHNHYIGLFPRDRNNNCYACQMQRISGFEGAKPGKNIEIAPSLTAVTTQQREDFPYGDFKEKDSRLDPGISFSWAFTNNLNLNATVNPDFSQVEADVAQLDINTQFALYYPEKRPFFLEGAQIFETRLPIMHTRALAEPDWGIKLSGKEGNNTIGFYSVQDNILNLLIPGSYGNDDVSLDLTTVGTVARYRRDIGRVSVLGLILTDREGKDYFNRVAGFDSYFRFTQHKELRLQFMGSQTRYPGEVALTFEQPEEKFTGTALDVVFRHSSRNFFYQFSFQQVSPNFRADLGFMPQVGYRNYTGWLEAVLFRNPGHWFTKLAFVPVAEYETDYDGNLIYKQLAFITKYTGPMQTYIELTGILGKRSFFGREFDISVVNFSATNQPSGHLLLQLAGAYGDQIDFTNAQQGKKLMLNPIITLKSGRHLSLTLDHVYERATVNAGRLYTANVTNFNFIYQFNRRAFLRTILQYVDYDYNVDNYIYPRDPKYKSLFTQILFSYKLNPQTVLFLGYSDIYYGFQQIPLTQNRWTLFLKVGYALVL